MILDAKLWPYYEPYLHSFIITLAKLLKKAVKIDDFIILFKFCALILRKSSVIYKKNTNFAIII